MTNEKQLQRVLNKAARLEKIYDSYIFRPVAEIDMEGWPCREHLRTARKENLFPPRYEARYRQSYASWR